MKNFDVIVIGGGASGLIAAGRASETGKKVLLLEKKERIGRKLLITGKGRCNITNKSPISEYFKCIYPKPRFLKHAFSTFFSDEIIELLEQQGVETTIERGNRVFPVSNSAADVVNALLKWVKSNNVEIRLNSNVEKILTENGIVTGVVIKIQNESEKETEIFASKVILCAGGSSYPATGSNGDGFKLSKKAGHTITQIRPALVPLETETKAVKDLFGLSLKNVKAIVWVNNKKQNELFGEMIFTHFGLSGPIILSLSRFIVDEILKNNEVYISIDLKPALDEQKLDTRLLRDLNENGKKQLGNILKQWLPAKMIPYFINKLELDRNKECHQVNAKERKKIRALMKNLKFKITGYRPFKEAIVTAGGISTNEINPKTLESKLIKNLHFAGEVIDIDADTGGYNLQIAFSTGWLAGNN